MGISRDEGDNCIYKRRGAKEIGDSQHKLPKPWPLLKTVDSQTPSQTSGLAEDLKAVTHKITFSLFYHCKLHLMELEQQLIPSLFLCSPRPRFLPLQCLFSVNAHPHLGPHQYPSGLPSGKTRQPRAESQGQGKCRDPRCANSVPKSSRFQDPSCLNLSLPGQQ